MNKTLKKITLSISIILLIHLSINAQNEIDALRFSELDWQGSARFMGAGKAFSAVGAEFSALNVNPAAIGLYKKSEVTFTPMTVSVYKNSSEYNGTATPGQRVRYNIGNAGIVLAVPGISSTLWKKIQVGFGYNRIANFNNVFSIEGRSKGSPLGSLFTAEANYKQLNANNSSAWYDELWAGWWAVLFDTVPGTETSYFTPLKDVDMFQSSSVVRKGGIDEMILSIGTNYDDMLFLGATIGVPCINFTEDRMYEEINDKEPDIVFRYYKMTDKLTVRSSGINLKLGIIYQPLDFLRLGLAFHTPTYYGNVKDNFDRKLYSATKYESLDMLPNDYLNYPNKFKYSLTTPLRATASVAFFIKQRAFISAEYEFADYSMATMYATDYNFSEENRTIQKMYGFSHIARIGAEVNINQLFAIRAGYNYISSPYKDEINDGSKHYASFGFGFRTNHFYGDFAYAFTTSKEKYWMLDPAFINAVNHKFITHRIVMTMGVRF
ncbi:MAG: outer membrane protein transport protein [Bacteroidetes bacterium]|nr:outer membrane protein transport protein [Bacteroidota bacterium]MCL1968035.1 outer membrane protein transport protein [Bacteroidota bacterium]